MGPPGRGGEIASRGPGPDPAPAVTLSPASPGPARVPYPWPHRHTREGLVPSSSHPSLLVAAAASIAAGAIHAAAAGSHAELAPLSMLFAVTAVVQVGWGAAALRSEARRVGKEGVGTCRCCGWPDY